MGLLEIDRPPIQLQNRQHQCDIRTPEKARFLAGCRVLARSCWRELTLEQIAAIRAATDPTAAPSNFVHRCAVWPKKPVHPSARRTPGVAPTVASAEIARRLPYQVVDAQGRFVAHDKHVLSMKDNNQSANLAALVDAGCAASKIEGRYRTWVT